MKPFIILALWAIAGWDVGAWAEAYTGIPSAVGIVIGVAIGAVFALAARQQIAASAARVPQAFAPTSTFEDARALDRAA